MNFLNFEEFNRTNPIYVSMVRNPVERIISWYYYQRQTWYLTEMEHESDPTFYKETFEECVRNEKEYCQFIPGNSIFTQSGTLGQKPQIIQRFTCWKSRFLQNSHFWNLNFHKFTFLKSHFFTKFTFLKSHFSQNSHF